MKNLNLTENAPFLPSSLLMKANVVLKYKMLYSLYLNVDLVNRM